MLYYKSDTQCSTDAACPGLTGTVFGANMEPSWVQVGAKSGPSWVQVGAKTGPRGALGEAQASRIDSERWRALPSTLACLYPCFCWLVHDRSVQITIV